ncbi:MAG: type IV secretion system DNA-binding domain-containing protein [Oscillospiraceae bacterium]|nr:type IV secretion system DNA-binding domain-containing protein [Oscillospiraceae bacterium]
MLTLSLVLIIPVFIVLYEQQKTYRINKIFNFRKELKRIRKQKRKVVNHKNATLIGYSGRQKVYIPDDAKHVFMCGTTGCGKTVALANFIAKGNPMLIVDGKGDTGERFYL